MRTDELLVGASFGPSQWIEITQDRVNAFANATDDHQWIHVDPVRAADGPYRGTIAHGWMSLALLAPVVFELLPVDGATLINYGAERVRFPSALPVGARVRGRLTITDVERLGAAIRLRLDAVVEREASDKPTCVAQVIIQVTSSVEGDRAIAQTLATG